MARSFFEISPFGFILDGDQSAAHFTDRDDIFFQIALREAQNGVGGTHPNPPVGAVVVKDGQVISTGFHERAGEPHGEAIALMRAGNKARGATLYVTLEPCSHFRKKTPPCAEHVVQSGIVRAVVGVSDPNPLVNGHGIERLRQAGIQVDMVKHKEQAACARQLIAPFEKAVRKEMPWLVAKMAASLDGRIAMVEGAQTELTGAESRAVVHQLRDRCDAILVGANTVAVDNPRLTTRLSDGKEGRHPLRVVVDSTLRTNPSANVYDRSHGNALVVHTSKASAEKIAEFDRAGIVRCEVSAQNGRVDLRSALQQICHKGITSVMLESGGKMLASLLAADLCDEFWWFTAPVLMGGQGVPSVAPIPNANFSTLRFGEAIKTKQLGNDVLSVAAMRASFLIA